MALERQPTNIYGIGLVLLLLIVVGGILNFDRIFSWARARSDAKEDSGRHKPTLQITSVNALGRLAPQGKIINIYPSHANQRVSQWLISEGQTVQQGDVIARLHGLEHAKAKLEYAKAQVQVAKAQEENLRQGENPDRIKAQDYKIKELKAHLAGQIEVQRSLIAQLKTRQEQKKINYERFQKLFDQGAIALSDLEMHASSYELAQSKLVEANGTLLQIRETGKEKIQQAKSFLASMHDIDEGESNIFQAEVRQALAAVKQADLEVNDHYVRAPISGQIIGIKSSVGEVVSSEGLATIGQTNQMYVTAEVHEGDIRLVKLGQEARIVSEYGGFLGELKGRVEKIGLEIDKPGLVNHRPGVMTDVRVVEVLIKINQEDSSIVSQLNNLQVRVSIDV